MVFNIGRYGRLHTLPLCIVVVVTGAVIDTMHNVVAANEAVGACNLVLEDFNVGLVQRMKKNIVHNVCHLLTISSVKSWSSGYTANRLW